MLKPHEDAVGRSLWHHWRGQESVSLIERDDGYADWMNTAWYFREPRAWLPATRQAMRGVKGRVLDVGCGAGSHALHLQERGHWVLGVDNSPLAVKVCRARGLKRARVCAATQATAALGTFDTILMMGNNFGLVANPKRARWMLDRFARMTSPAARIVAQTTNVYGTSRPAHRAYHRRNRRRGRLAGQIRLRIRFETYRTPWFDYLMVSPTEMRRIVRDTPWRIERLLGHSKTGTYTALLGKRTSR